MIKTSRFLMKMGMDRIAQAKYISSLEERIASRDSLIEMILNNMEEITKNR